MEANNMAAMREALEHVLEEYESLKEDDCFEDGDCNLCDEKNELCWMEKSARLIRAALAAPARNCDVGTAEEQAERYHATGEVYHTLTLTNALEWAQMPYEEGGAK